MDRLFSPLRVLSAAIVIALIVAGILYSFQLGIYNDSFHKVQDYNYATKNYAVEDLNDPTASPNDILGYSDLMVDTDGNIGYLSVPNRRLQWDVGNGNSSNENELRHVYGTALPVKGGADNLMVLSTHDLKMIQEIEPGDIIVLKTAFSDRQYTVTGSKVVENISYLRSRVGKTDLLDIVAPFPDSSSSYNFAVETSLIKEDVYFGYSSPGLMKVLLLLLGSLLGVILIPPLIRLIKRLIPRSRRPSSNNKKNREVPQ